MQTIEVNREKLIETVRKNRDEHRATFLTAQEKFREEVVKRLDERLQEVRDGKRIVLHIALPEPVDYTTTYDEAIAALEWDVREVVELGQREFNELVLNKWGWSDVFAANTRSYVAG